MHASFLQSLTSSGKSARAPSLIAVGFAVLLASTWWTAVPVITAMAIVALGATEAWASRPHRVLSTYVLMGVQLFVYLNLYFLFVGAVCDVAMRASGISFLIGFDLVVSVVPMAMVVRRSFAVLGGGGNAPAR